MMITFLFEQYGYYPSDFQNNEFYIKDWHFKLIEIEANEEYIKKIDNHIALARQSFDGRGAYLIKTRFGELISFYGDKAFVLVGVKSGTASIKDLNKMHMIFRNIEHSVDLNKVSMAWQTRIDYIENVAIANLRVDSVYYSDNLDVAMFCIGMCQNAIQYLNDGILDYGGELQNVTLTHKRLQNLDSFGFFNPLNLVVDHPIRDLVELYRNDFFGFNDLIDVIQYYEIDRKAASFFMARLLYPVSAFDMLDYNTYSKKNDFKLCFNIEKELNKIKKAYIYFKEKYNIRPIEWLEKHSIL